MHGSAGVGRAHASALQPPRAPIALVASVLLLVALLLVGSSSPALATPAEREAEAEFLALVNVERARKGLGAVVRRSDIVKVARGWSGEMASRGKLAHNPNYSKQIRGWQRVSENVGYGPTVGAIHRALMASDGHRLNILDDRVTEVGIGVVIRDGRVWVTQNFRRPSSGAVAAPPTIVQFGDVSSDGVHADAIASVASAGIESGCSPVRFCPSDSVTRAAFASMLARAMGVPPTSERHFDDVSGEHAANIEALAAAGITEGCAPRRFCPDQQLSRMQLASFMARSLGYGPGKAPFTDVPRAHADTVGALYERGIVTGCTTTRFCSTQPVTRAQTASMLARTFG